MSEQVQYGGQAVIEGVMMRGKKHFAVACRRASGEIVLKKEPVPIFLRSEGWLRWPFVRGVVALVDSLYLGMKTLLYSGDIAMEDAQEADKEKESESNPKEKNSKVSDIAIPVTMVLGLVIALFLFKFIPLAITQWMSVKFHILGNVNNLIDGLIRMAIFIGYLLVISWMPDVRRVFQYHGAEHKTINAYESGSPLTPENVQKYTTRHPRCGTTFILLVLVIQIILLLFTGWHWSFLVKFVVRILLLIPVAGISYEIIRIAGRHKDSPFWNIIVAPGMWLQSLTTREPADSMVEVAIASLEGVFDQETQEIKNN